jgi:hypothetical protein
VPAADTGHYYSFDWGDVHFANVDTNLLGTASQAGMLNWLDQDLGATDKYWRIVFYHHPSYPTGAHVGDPLCVMAHSHLNPIVEKHGVQLVLSGHEHAFERTYPLLSDAPVASGTGTTYIISGGGGADLETVGTLPQTALSMQVHNYSRVDVNGGQLTLSAMGVTGQMFDQIVLNPMPVVPAAGIVSSANFSNGSASGWEVSIFGFNLAVQAAASSSAPLPTILNGVSVKMGTEYASLQYVSPTQINCQTSKNLTGMVAVEIITPNGSVTRNHRFARI